MDPEVIVEEVLTTQEDIISEVTEEVAVEETPVDFETTDEAYAAPEAEVVVEEVIA